MSRPPRTTNTGTFFITAITLMRRRRFQVDTTALLFLETLQHYRRTGIYKLHAFAVMPDHIHLLITTDDLPKAMKDLKGSFAHKMGGERFWQQGYTDHVVRDRADFDAHVTYIHQNPVRKRLVETAEDYPYSSAYRGGVRVSKEESS